MITSILIVSGATVSNGEVSNGYNANLVKYLKAGIFAGFGLVFCACGVYYRKSLKLAKDVLNASSDFIFDTRRAVYISIAICVFLSVLGYVFLCAFMSILSLNEIAQDYFQAEVMYLVWHPTVIPQAIFAVFGFAWIISLILYTNAFIIMLSAATYYYSAGGEKKNKETLYDDNGDKVPEIENEPQAEVAWAVKQVFFSHFGSLAKGTLLVSILKVLKFIFLYPA